MCKGTIRGWMEETPERIYEWRKVKIEETLKKGNTEGKRKGGKRSPFLFGKAILKSFIL